MPQLRKQHQLSPRKNDNAVLRKRSRQESAPAVLTYKQIRDENASNPDSEALDYFSLWPFTTSLSDSVSRLLGLPPTVVHSGCLPLSSVEPLLQHIATSCDLRAAMRIASPQHAEEFCSFLQEIFDMSPDVHRLSSRRSIIRLIQDVCSTSGVLPSQYRLYGVRIERRINSGGEAVIYRGIFEGKVVAIRERYSPRGADWSSMAGIEALKTIRREIIAHWQLRHPNLLPLIGVCFEVQGFAAFEGQDCLPLIVLPFIGRGTAIDWLETNASGPAYLKIVIGTMNGLAYLHAQDPPVIHGDLHAGNVLLNDDGEPLLCDFGMTRFRHEITRSLTGIQSGGKLRYLAPELSSGPDLFRTTEANLRAGDDLPRARNPSAPLS